jgi:hypothetical protein
LSARVHLLGWIVLATVLSPATVSAEPLRHDIFARPFNVGTTTSTSGVGTRQHPKLFAVMVAGDKSLVNLNGTIIGIGEEKDGFRLMSVLDGKAIFKKRRKWVVMDMDMPSLTSVNQRGNQ